MSHAGYSTLEEAWGIKPQSRRARRARKKSATEPFEAPYTRSDMDERIADPICDLYDQKFRKKKRTIESEYTPWDAESSIHQPFSVIPEDEYIEAFDDIAAPGPDSAGSTGLESPGPAPFPAIQTRSCAGGPRPHENHDLFMFVFSGVLLLFVLEQFIQVGLHIGTRSAV